jgi:hypothetical protein
MTDISPQKTRREPNHKRLTDSYLKALKSRVPGQRDLVWDTVQPGMAVRISAEGKRSFYVVRRRSPEDRSPVWFRLGPYPRLTLSQARVAAGEALDTLDRGEHP